MKALVRGRGKSITASAKSHVPESVLMKEKKEKGKFHQCTGFGGGGKVRQLVGLRGDGHHYQKKTPGSEKATW